MALGNVIITRQGKRLAADRIVFNQKTGDVQAQGHVMLTTGKDVLTGSRVELNLNTRLGVIDQGADERGVALAWCEELKERVEGVGEVAVGAEGVGRCQCHRVNTEVHVYVLQEVHVEHEEAGADVDLEVASLAETVEELLDLLVDFRGVDDHDAAVAILDAVAGLFLEGLGAGPALPGPGGDGAADELNPTLPQGLIGGLVLDHELPGLLDDAEEFVARAGLLDLGGASEGGADRAGGDDQFADVVVLLDRLVEEASGDGDEDGVVAEGVGGLGKDFELLERGR